MFSSHFNSIAIKQIEDRDNLIVAFADPMDLEVIDELRFMVNMPIFRIVGTEEAIIKAIQKQYTSEDNGQKGST